VGDGSLFTSTEPEQGVVAIRSKKDGQPIPPPNAASETRKKGALTILGQALGQGMPASPDGKLNYKAQRQRGGPGRVRGSRDTGKAQERLPMGAKKNRAKGTVSIGTKAKVVRETSLIRKMNPN